MILIIFISKF